MTAPNGSNQIIVRRSGFSFSYEPATNEFAMQSDQGRLRLACQGALSQPGKLDAGLVWEFVGAEEEDGSVKWRFAATRTCWNKKEFCVEITQEEVLFHMEIEGGGMIDRAVFFAGYSPGLLSEPKSTFGTLHWARPEWNRHWSGSPLSFASVLNPQPVLPGNQRLASGVSQRITCAGTFGPEVFNTFFGPPLFAYGFDDSFSLGVLSTIAASRFHHFDFTSTSGWGLELHYDGKTSVAGTWRSPAIRLAPCQEAEAGLDGYATYLRRNGLAPQPDPDVPEWAQRPIFCGWGQQTVWANEAEKGQVPPVGSPVTEGAAGYAHQEGYEAILRLLEERDIPYGTFTIDAGWSLCQTIPLPDESRWPDMRGFIDRLHRKGKRVFLWLATWNPGGLEELLRMPHAPGLPDCCDPTHPVFRERLAEAIAHAVSPDGLNADGFKVDYTVDVPRGDYRPVGDLWGLALIHDYVKLIHDSMKRAKSGTILETHCANPQFADVTEMIRLNDIFCTREDVRPMMKFRARMARIALPDCLIDTECDPFISREAWMDYVRLQPELGIPSVHSLTHACFSAPGADPEVILPEDWEEIRRIWLQYAGKSPNPGTPTP